MIYRLTFIFLILILSSCSKKIFFGTYENTIKGLSYEAIQINPDSTFDYKYRIGEWESNNSFGKWTRDKKIIILNSKYRRDSLPIQAIVSLDTSIVGYKFNFLEFFDPNINEGFWQNLIINNTSKIRITDSSMIIKYPEEIKTFKVQIVGTQLLTDTVGLYILNTINYQLNKNAGNVFIVDYPFNGNFLRYKDFINERFKIKYKNIYWIKKRLNYHLREK